MRRALALVILSLQLFATGGSSQPVTFSQAPSGAVITYRLRHPLHSFEAVSKDATIRVTADASTHAITAVVARVDVTSFDSGNSNRDSHAMEVVDAITYPDVTFKSSEVHAIGDSLVVAGSLTFHGVTKTVMIAARPEWGPGSLYVVGHFAISMTAFNIERPSLLMMPVEDTIHFSIASRFDFPK